MTVNPRLMHVLATRAWPLFLAGNASALGGDDPREHVNDFLCRQRLEQDGHTWPSGRCGRFGLTRIEDKRKVTSRNPLYDIPDRMAVEAQIDDCGGVGRRRRSL